METYLQIESVSKQFGQFTALTTFLLRSIKANSSAFLVHQVAVKQPYYVPLQG